MARPRLHPVDRKSERLEIRLTSRHKHLLEALALHNDIDVASVARSIIVRELEQLICDSYRSKRRLHASETRAELPPAQNG